MGGGSSAPKAYTPAYQPQADAAYYGTLSGLTNTDTANQAFVDTGYQGAYNNIATNPYAQQMVQGTVAAANTANQVGANDLTAGKTLYGASGQGYADANTVRGYAPQFQDLAAIAKGYAAPLAADANTLRSYGPWLAEMGLDPNMAEYNYGLQQTKDSQNVLNAESGLAGSPFAAGATGDAMAAYKRNYDASRLSKGMAALAALSGLYSGAGGLNMQALQALQASGGFTGDAANMYDTAGRMDTNAGNLAVGASDLEHTGAQTQAAAAVMPYEAVNELSQSEIDALNAMSTGESNMSRNLNNDASGFGNYMTVGQNATALDQKAAQINYQDSFMGGLGQMLGIAAQIGAHFIPGYGG